MYLLLHTSQPLRFRGVTGEIALRLRLFLNADQPMGYFFQATHTLLLSFLGHFNTRLPGRRATVTLRLVPFFHATRTLDLHFLRSLFSLSPLTLLFRVGRVGSWVPLRNFCLDLVRNRLSHGG